MMMEIEDRFGKAANAFSLVLSNLQSAAKRGDAVHEIKETTFRGLMKMGREIVAAYSQEQEETLPRPETIEYEGKRLHRMRERRTREYVSAFGPAPFERHVCATRETQRQEVVPSLHGRTAAGQYIPDHRAQ